MREWTRIGLIGFGGPPAHIALLRELVVERNGWMDGEAFTDANAACALLPGPASTQLGAPRHFISQIEDISERKHAEVRLQQAVISAMHDGYALTVADELKVVNEALCALTGFSEAELVGARVPFPFWPPERLDETMSLGREILTQQGGSSEEVTLMRVTASASKPRSPPSSPGGEEFAWLLPEARLSEAVLAADRARLAISAVAFRIAGRLTMSAGVGVMHAPGDGDALYRLADRALYDAKQGGRDRTYYLTFGLGEPTGSAAPAPTFTSG